jgi:hypothetical protein
MLCVQSDREKEEGLPVAPFMDRDKVTKPTAQIGFIKFVLLPMFEAIAKVRRHAVFLFCNIDYLLDLCFHLSAMQLCRHTPVRVCYI